MARKVSIANKKDLVLESASKLFCHYGFEKTTIDDIARDAGIGKGTIYSEFKSKEEIMLHVISKFMCSVNLKLKTLIDETENFNYETVRAILITKILLCYDHAKNNFHGADLFIFPFEKIKDRDEIYIETDSIIAELLNKIPMNGEIFENNDNLAIAKCIRKALSCFSPPSVLEIDSREEIIAQANEVLDLLLFGLIKKEAKNEHYS